MAQSNGHRRVAIVRGLRTPFVKAGSVFGKLTALDLGRLVVQELVQRAELDPNEIHQLVFGQVIPTLTAPSIAREVVIAAGLPRKIEAKQSAPARPMRQRIRSWRRWGWLRGRVPSA